jgi:uncharacterized membrane protein YcaP (DUF421 family)
MQTVIRITVIYLVIMAGLRLLGKREFGQLTPLELVTLLLIPEITTQAISLEDHSLTNAIIGITTLLSLVYITSMLTHYFPRVEKIIASTPAVLVEHGEFVEDNMNKERISPSEIFDAIHKAGLYQLSQVRWVLLQSDGKIAVIPESDESPLQPQMDQGEEGFK